MSNYSDDKAERLRISGFDEGHVNDSEVAWLKDRVAWETGDLDGLPTLWGLYLETQGFAGHINDATFAWLGSLGYNLSDDVTDRLADFWADPLPLP